MTRNQLTEKILDFMAIISECHANTSFANDRLLYARDVATAMGWIVELKRGVDVEKVITKILSPETDKYFGDYWKQGGWGADEVNALKKLQNSL